MYRYSYDHLPREGGGGLWQVQSANLHWGSGLETNLLLPGDRGAKWQMKIRWLAVHFHTKEGINVKEMIGCTPVQCRMILAAMITSSNCFVNAGCPHRGLSMPGYMC